MSEAALIAAGAPESFSHLYKDYALTPKRRETSRTGYPRTAI